ncbi:MAG TPA: sigma-70 family RNA polymerase sigma factor [Actinomycetota bacterium]|jgi:RNA polymerase sigma-70 factor (ECF subfamily)|nr:sigma-70 family RNA polymerase sigma factor [Actinomycetota bacterium]
MTATPTELETARDDALAAVRARLHGFLARRVESPEVADDLTQEVLLRLLQHQDSAVENPTAWLYRVARNVLIDHYRSRGSYRRLHTADPALADMVLAEEPFADDPQAAQREVAGCLRSLVDQLAEPYRSAVTAVDLDGRTQTEVARALRLSVSGMKSRVQRGRRQLRQLLTECCRVHTSPTGGITDYEPGAHCEDDPAVQGNQRCRSGCQ